MTNRWWEIKKKLWGEEVARAAGEKTRQLATAAGVKRKREVRASNPPPPKPVKEKLKWYDLPPNTMAAAADNSVAVAAAAAPTISYSYGAMAAPSVANAGGAGGDCDGVADVAAAADVKANAAMTTPMSTLTTTAARAARDQYMNGLPTPHDDVPDDGPAHDHNEILEHDGHGEDAGVV